MIFAIGAVGWRWVPQRLIRRCRIRSRGMLRRQLRLLPLTLVHAFIDVVMHRAREIVHVGDSPSGPDGVDLFSQGAGPISARACQTAEAYRVRDGNPESPANRLGESISPDRTRAAWSRHSLRTWGNGSALITKAPAQQQASAGGITRPGAP